MVVLPIELLIFVNIWFLISLPEVSLGGFGRFVGLLALLFDHLFDFVELVQYLFEIAINLFIQVLFLVCNVRVFGLLLIRLCF